MAGMEDHREDLDRIANYLYEKETITKEEIESVVEANSDYRFDKDDKVINNDEDDQSISEEIKVK